MTLPCAQDVHLGFIHQPGCGVQNLHWGSSVVVTDWTTGHMAEFSLSSSAAEHQAQAPDLYNTVCLSSITLLPHHESSVSMCCHNPLRTEMLLSQGKVQGSEALARLNKGL